MTRPVSYQFISRQFVTSANVFSLQKVKESAEFSNGRKLVLECGNYAKLADGSVVASVGDTSVLVTAVGKPRISGYAGFVPLTVDYRQKYAAAGHIPSNYLRRELAPTEKEILTSRVVDRSVRPLFPSNFNFDTQLTCHLLAVDGLHEPDVVSINGASAALALSSIPWNGPVGAVRLGCIDGEVVTFPTRRELRESALNLVVTASDRDHIVMLEGSGAPIALHDLEKAIKVGVGECQQIVNAIKGLRAVGGQSKRVCEDPVPIPEEVLSGTRDTAVNDLRLDTAQKLAESFPEVDKALFNQAFLDLTKEVFRNLILDENIRCDGRGLTDLRPISCSVNLFKPLHGSSVFQRGHTQVQCTVAFDSPEKALSLDPLLEVTGGIKDRNFFLHYSFPSYANNELSRGGPAVSRREIGHGALAAKAILPIIPKNHPFTILLTSTVMESNGSSSMATVCGGTLALMDAGVNVLSPAAGVAMGLITKFNEKEELESYAVLTDILGIEDYFGDMDFKIAGTKDGITAIQADIKLQGVPIRIIKDVLVRSNAARKDILNIMNEVISRPRTDKENLPVTATKEIPPHLRGVFLGPAGTNIKRIQAETGVQITWQDNETISVFASSQIAMDEAFQIIDTYLMEEPELQFGGIYAATITEIRPQGVMVTLYIGMTPVLLHNSQLDIKRVHHPDVLGMEVGQQIRVKYFGRDPTSGHMRLSRRALMASPIPSGTKNLHEVKSG